MATAITALALSSILASKSLLVSYKSYKLNERKEIEANEKALREFRAEFNKSLKDLQKCS
jgi:di/tricarboxylate transporter